MHSHAYTGEFSIHDGLNSTLESVCVGVPMLSWPFYVEKYINRTFIFQVWKIEILVNDDEKRKDVQEKVKRLM